MITGLVELREPTTTEQQQYAKVQDFNNKMVTEIVIMNMSSSTVKLKHKSEVSEIVDMSEKEIDEIEVMDLINNDESHYKRVDEPTFSPEIELDSLLKIPFLRIVHNTYLKQKEKETRASKEQEKAQTEEDGTSDKEAKVVVKFFEEKWSSAIKILLSKTQMTEMSQAEWPEHCREAIHEFALHETNLNIGQVIKLAETLNRYKDVWDNKSTEKPIQHVSGAEMQIDTGDSAPIRSRMRKSTMAEDLITKDHICRMSGRKVIRPSKSPWASPVLLAAKKGGKVRFCIDYRCLNDVTKKDSYPIPRIDDILSQLGGAKHFSTMDLTDAFWSIPVAEEDIPKTAFISKYGLWEWVSMPFGLANAPPTQQRFMEKIFASLLWQCCFVYIDDILIYSQSFDDHIEHIERVFNVIKDNKLVVQACKCSFCKPTFEILGFKATPEGLKMSDDKVKAIAEYKKPETKSEMTSFLGLVAWLRKLIPQCSALTNPLRDALADPEQDGKSKAKSKAKTKSRELVWTEEMSKSYDKIIQTLINDPVIAYPNTDKEFYIHVDASALGLGAILTQLDDEGKHRVVEYASKRLTKTQSLYSNSVREGLGVLWSLDHFKYYIHGRNTTVFCDCNAVVDCFRSKEHIPQNRMLRDWVARILNYGVTIKHKPGKLMAIPDALSRNFVKYDKYITDENNLLLDILQDALHGTNNASTEKLDSMGDYEHDLPEDTIRTLNTIMVTRQRARQADIQQVGERARNSTHEVDMTPMSEDTQATMAEKSEKEVHIADNEEDSVMNDQILSKIALEQQADPEILEVIKYKTEGKLPSNKHLAKSLLAREYKYALDINGILCKVDENLPDIIEEAPLVLPRSLWEDTVKHYHEPAMAGHRKFNKLYRL